MPFEKVKAATVQLAKGGQGVLVPGELIVTAAHVIGWSAEGWMALGGYYIEEVKVADGSTLTIQTLAVEPVVDIAILGEPDGQASEELRLAAEAFSDFCEATAPVPIFAADLPLRSSFLVHILTHTGRWVDAQATYFTGARLWIEASEGIERGTSGGPVVTVDGLLLGVVSTAHGPLDQPKREGSVACVHLAAPAWLVRRMIKGGE